MPTSKSQGAQWLRCDLHVHTPFDSQKEFGEDIRAALQALRKEKPQRLAEITERFVEACRAAADGAGLDLVALTDHNSIDGYRHLRPQFDSLAQQARNENLPMPVILPGVEFSIGGERPIHFLAIFAADTSAEDIERLIRFLFEEREPFDQKTGTPRATGESVGTFLERFYKYCRPDTGERNLQFVLLPAHADGGRGVGRETGARDLVVATGIWEEMRGHLRQRAVSRRDWNGFETGRPFQRLSQAFQDLLLRWAAARRGVDWDTLTDSEKSRYREQRHWALVECSDPHQYEAIGTRYSWLKMEVPDVEGIRLALLDPESRLRRMSDGPPAHAYPRIERLRVRQTDFFEDIEIGINPCLTTLIGGRGSGKSTLIEYIRYAIDRARREDFPSEGLEDIRTAVESFLAPKRARDYGETPGTPLPGHEVDLEVVVAEQRYCVRRTAEGIKISRRDSPESEHIPLDVRTLLAPRILSQRQIALLAKDPSSQRSELDALLDQDELRKITDGRRALVERMTQLQTTRTRLKDRQKNLSARETELQKVNDQIAFLEKSGGKEVLSRFEAFERERHWLESAIRELEVQVKGFEEQATETESAMEGLGEVPEKGPNAARLDALSRRARERVRLAAATFRAEAAAFRELVGAIANERTERWQPGYNAARQEYDSLRNEMQKRGVDFTQHEKLLQRRALLEREVQELRGLVQEIERVEKDIRTARSDLVQLHERRLSLRRNQAKALEDLDADVSLDISAFRDRADFETRREEWFAGTGVQERDWTVLVDYVFAPNGSIPDRIYDVVASLREDIEQTAQQGRALDSSSSALAGRLGHQLTGHFFRALVSGARIRLDEIERFLPEDAVEARVRGADRTFKPIQTGSLGERSTAMLSLLLSAGDQPLIIDQPEDDLDNRYVYDVVVDLLRRRKFSRQIIIATHNANIPVNGDAELIVALGVHDRLGSVLVSGSIDRPEVKEHVTVIMEGSAEAFRLRRERYGY